MRDVCFSSLPISCRVLSVFGLMVAGLSAEAVRHFAAGSLALEAGLRGLSPVAPDGGGLEEVTVVFLVYVSTDELLRSVVIFCSSFKSNLTLVFCGVFALSRPLSPSFSVASPAASPFASIFKGTSRSGALLSLLKVDQGGG